MQTDPTNAAPSPEITPDDATRAEIVKAMARAFFATAWADLAEESGENLMGVEIMNAIPDTIDPAAVLAAEDLANRMETQYGGSLAALLRKAQAHPDKYADRECTPENFGHYAAMQAMGHGVGLESVCDREAFPDMPYLEFSHFDFYAADYFSDAEDDGPEY